MREMTRYKIPDGLEDVHVFLMSERAESSKLSLFPDLYTSLKPIYLIGKDVVDAWLWLEFRLRLLKFGTPPTADSGTLNYSDENYTIRHLFSPRTKLNFNRSKPNSVSIDSRLTRVSARSPYILLHLNAEDFVDYSDTDPIKELNDWDRNKIRSEQIPAYAGEEILRKRLERPDPDLHKLLEQTELDRVLREFSENSGWQYRVVVRSFNPIYDSHTADYVEL